MAPPLKPRPRRPVAIALSYEKGRDPAPRVVATGRDRVAQQILEIAFAAGIKVREDADLAEVLAAVEVDSVIPLEAFAAVAEIIAYLYRCNEAMASGANRTGGRPAVLSLGESPLGSPRAGHATGSQA